MPLHLAPKKSYHPYNRENRERVARDEADARAKQAEDDAYLAARDRSDRIAQLRRQRDAKIPRGDAERRAADAALGRDTIDSAPTSINFFADLEQAEAEAPPAKRAPPLKQTIELHPWYMDPKKLSGHEKRASDEQKAVLRYVSLANRSRQDEARKQREDPLAHMPRAARIAQPASSSTSLEEERKQREVREAERAAALLADRSSAFFRRRARAERAARVPRTS